jgi:hypothetical protein
MSASARRFLSSALLIALAACSSPIGANTPSAGAPSVQSSDPISAALDAAPEVTGGHALFRKLAIHPDAGSPPIIINFVSDGLDQGGVPCIDCVNGAQTGDNVGLTGPESFVPKGDEWMYALSFTDVAYKGSCKLAWTIVGGGKTVDSFSATLNLTQAGGYVLYAIARPRQAYHGAATLTGRATCGKSKPSLSAPLYFQ